MHDQEPRIAQSAPSGGVLIARLRARDPGALEILMERHASHVFRVAFSIIRNGADAEEVVQDVFLSLFEKISAFQERAALGTWLYRVTINAALVRRRGKRVELEVSLEDQLPTFREGGHRAGERSLLLTDWSASAEDEVLSAETHALVRRAIDMLPAHYRAVVMLRDLEELSNEQTAEILGEAVSSVKSRLHRARLSLREQLTLLMSGAPARTLGGACTAAGKGLAVRAGSTRPARPPGCRPAQTPLDHPPAHSMGSNDEVGRFVTSHTERSGFRVPVSRGMSRQSVGS